MTHTPGPWRVCRFDDGNIFIDGPSKARAAICKMLPPCGYYTNGETYEKIDVSSENAANARLIAASPVLLEALKELGDWNLHSKCADGTPAKNAEASLANARRFARAAITAAEGN